MEIKNRQKFLLIVAGAAIVLLLSDSLIIEPLMNGWKHRQERLHTLRDNIKKGEREIKYKERTLLDWDQMRTNTLPDNISLAESELLKAFDRWSKESGISVASIKPQWKQADETYMTLECRADATGSMQTLARFLYNVEKDPLAVKIENVEITARDNTGQQLSLGLQVSGLLLTPGAK